MSDIGIDFYAASVPGDLPKSDNGHVPDDNPTWPFPIQCVPDEGSEQILAEFCEIALIDGRKLAGTLVDFVPATRTLTVLATDSADLEKVEFNDLLSLRLTRAVPIQNPRQRLTIDTGKPFVQSYTLTLLDGVSISGDTSGSVEDEAGLYLYLPIDTDTVERHFYPYSALRSHQVGELLGEILLETNQVTRSDLQSALVEQRLSRTQRLGELLQKNHAINREDLAAALKRQESMPVMRLGEALLQMKYVSQEQLNAALEQQRSDRKIPLGQILVNAGMIDEQHLKQALAEKLGIPFVDLNAFPVEFDASSRLSEDIARKYNAMPLYAEQGVLVVAMNDPLNSAHTESLRFHVQMRIAPVMATSAAITRALDRCYGRASLIEAWGAPTATEKLPETISFSNNAEEKTKTEELVSQLNRSASAPVEVNEPQVADSDNSLVKLVNKIMIDASQQRATDIHIENYPDKQDTCVRFRRDGALYDYLQIPHRFRSAIVSRIKIMSSLDISEKRRPQDGKLEFSLPGEPKLELRVATIPTANGLEDIVMRLLAGATLRSLEHIGMDAHMTTELQRLIAKPYGMILVCGPTGSGKTTTLHSLLGQINTRERKTCT